MERKSCWFPLTDARNSRLGISLARCGMGGHFYNYFSYIRGVSHQSVRLLLQDVAKSLADNIQFDAGRWSEFDLIQGKTYPWIWLLPITGNPRFAVNNTENYQKTWNISMLFLDQDQFDANQGETNTVLDRMDFLIDQFIVRLNDWSMKISQDTVGAITITNISQEPLYKKDAAIESGWGVRFQLTTPDDFIYCTPDNIEIYANN